MNPRTLSFEALSSLGTHSHNAHRLAIFHGFERGADGAGAVLEPHMRDYPDVFGPPTSADVDDVRPDVLVLDAGGGRTWLDDTVGWQAQLDPVAELLKPGATEEHARARKYKHYNDAYDGAGAKVHTVFVGAHGDVTGGSRQLLGQLARRRAEERASRAERADENWTYCNQISAMRCAMSVAFWRGRANMRRAVRTPRALWASVGLAEVAAREEEGGEAQAGPGAAAAPVPEGLAGEGGVMGDGA